METCLVIDRKTYIHGYIIIDAIQNDIINIIGNTCANNIKFNKLKEHVFTLKKELTDNTVLITITHRPDLIIIPVTNESNNVILEAYKTIGYWVYVTRKCDKIEKPVISVEALLKAYNEF